VTLRSLTVTPDALDGALAARFAEIRRELDVREEFPEDALREAERAAARAERPGEDLTDLPLVTLDPAGSRDLDQAFHIAPVDGRPHLVPHAGRRGGR